MVWTKFQAFVEQKYTGQHILFGENDVVVGSGVATLKVYLSNTAPNVATMTSKADLAEIVLTGGYLGPVTLKTNGTRALGVFTLQARSKIIAQQTGPVDIGPFRYAVLYNSSSVTPANALIAYVDFGSPQTLLNGTGDTVDIRFNNVAIGSFGTIFTDS